MFKGLIELFGLPSTIRTCDLRLRRICGYLNMYIFQWFTRLNRDCVINCAMFNQKKFEAGASFIAYKQLGVFLIICRWITF
jgi:hypothetical protein